MAKEQSAEHVVESLKSMMSTPGWSYLYQIITEQIEDLEREILEEAQDNSLIYTKFDKLKIERKKLKMLIEMPQEIINELSLRDNKEDDPDPYDRVESES